MAKRKQEHQNDREYYFESYKEFAWRFRLWLVTYGAGIPVITLANKDIFERIIDSRYGYIAMIFVLFGVGIQIFITWVFKTCMWYCDRQAKGELSEKSRRFRSAVWITENYWIEIILDFLTLVLYGSSTCYLIFLIFHYK
jgi:hypothetical protein